jgi:hypothetical protein
MFIGPEFECPQPTSTEAPVQHGERTEHEVFRAQGLFDAKMGIYLDRILEVRAGYDAALLQNSLGLFTSSVIGIALVRIAVVRTSIGLPNAVFELGALYEVPKSAETPSLLAIDSDPATPHVVRGGTIRRDSQGNPLGNLRSQQRFDTSLSLAPLHNSSKSRSHGNAIAAPIRAAVHVRRSKHSHD